MEKSLQKTEKYSYFIKGSGTSYCLINGSCEDQRQFIPFKFRDFISVEDKNFHVKEISMAGLYLIILLENGQTYKLGSFNNHSEIFKVPLQIFPNKIIVKKVSSGWDHSVFMTQQNHFWGLGSNKFGQLPSCSDKKYFYNPQKLQFSENIKTQSIFQFTCGFRQTYFINENNQIFGCGESKKYQLGQKSLKTISYKQLGVLNAKVKKIVCAKRSVFLLTYESDLYAMGFNQFKIFNQEQNKQKQKSQFLDKFTKTNSNVNDISCGWSHIIVIKKMEQKYWIESYGRNNFSQLGRQTNSEKALVKIQVNQNSYLCCGSEFSFLKVQEKLYGWGWNQHQNIINTPEQIVLQPRNIPYPTQSDQCTRIWSYPAITIIQLKSDKNQTQIL